MPGAVPVPYLPRRNDSPDTLNTAAAGQDQAQIHRSLKTKGKGKAPALELVLDETDPEDYNIRSARRTELLTELKGLFKDDPVTPALWACCQLCDVEELSELVASARRNPHRVHVYEDSLNCVPLLCKLLVLRP